jgi:hypothetical protein
VSALDKLQQHGRRTPYSPAIRRLFVRRHRDTAILASIRQSVPSLRELIVTATLQNYEPRGFYELHFYSVTAHADDGTAKGWPRFPQLASVAILDRWLRHEYLCEDETVKDVGGAWVAFVKEWLLDPAALAAL